jgi:hypothetical protein
MAKMVFVPLALLTACGGGDGSSSSNQNDNLPPSLNAAISTVPLAGELIADCADTGVGVIDSVIDAVKAATGSSLPAALPKLSDVLAMADLAKVPVIGGVVVNAEGQLGSISADQVTALLPAGVPGLANLPIPGQLPAICSSLVSFVPAGATTDPTAQRPRDAPRPVTVALLDALGSVTGALGVIPVLDGSNNPVGVLLATVPAGLVHGAGSGIRLPGVTSLPDLTSLAPLDPASVSSVGGVLSSLTSELLGLLEANGLVSGDLLGLVFSLLP